MDKLYSLDKSENAEIKLRFYKIALKAGPEYCDSAASEHPTTARSKPC